MRNSLGNVVAEQSQEVFLVVERFFHLWIVLPDFLIISDASEYWTSKYSAPVHIQTKGTSKNEVEQFKDRDSRFLSPSLPDIFFVLILRIGPDIGFDDKYNYFLNDIK